jgi:regulator of replication initiation timing
MRLDDYIGPLRYSVINESETTGPLLCDGVIGRADEKNANGRIYTRKLWEKILSSPSLQETIRERGMVGEVDHPKDSELKLEKASHVWTSMSLQENGEIHGTFEVLPTEKGRHLESLIRSRIRVGASTRGEGTISSKDGADYISEDDYNLYTTDIVANPSTRGAFPKVRESAETQEKESSMGAKETFSQLREQANRLIALEGREVSESSRSSIEAQIDGVIESLDRVVAEDKGLTSLGTALTSDLLETKKSIRKAIPVESKLSASETLSEAVKAKYIGLKKEAKTSVETLLKENAKLKAENAKLRQAYAVAIQEGETVLEEKREALKRYSLAMEAGERLLQRAKSMQAVNESKKNGSKPPAATGSRAVTEKTVQGAAAVTPKKVVQVTEATPQTAASNHIQEAANFASSLLQSGHFGH